MESASSGPDDERRQRDEHGYLVPGCDPQNLTGKNQWTSESLAAKRARVTRRLQLRTLEKVDLCVETASDNWARAIESPDLAPHTAKLATGFCFPESKNAEPDPNPPDSSADQWEAIAEKVEVEVLRLVEDDGA